MPDDRGRTVRPHRNPHPPIPQITPVIGRHHELPGRIEAGDKGLRISRITDIGLNGGKNREGVSAFIANSSRLTGYINRI